MIVKLNPEYVERLEQVIRVLEELPYGYHLGMAAWFTCGTTACACGWAAQDPWFIKRDFKLARDGSKFNVYQIFHGIQEGRRAVQMFFGISPKDFEYLFLPNMYQEVDGVRGNKSVVIDRLKGFIRVKRDD